MKAIDRVKALAAALEEAVRKPVKAGDPRMPYFEMLLKQAAEWELFRKKVEAAKEKREAKTG